MRRLPRKWATSAGPPKCSTAQSAGARRLADRVHEPGAADDVDAKGDEYHGDDPAAGALQHLDEALPGATSSDVATHHTAIPAANTVTVTVVSAGPMMRNAAV